MRSVVRQNGFWHRSVEGCSCELLMLVPRGVPPSNVGWSQPVYTASRGIVYTARSRDKSTASATTMM